MVLFKEWMETFLEGSWSGWSGDRSDLEGRKHNTGFIQAKMKTSAFKKCFKIILKIFLVLCQWNWPNFTIHEELNSFIWKNFFQEQTQQYFWSWNTTLLGCQCSRELDYSTETDVINNSRPRSNYMSQYERVLSILNLVRLWGNTRTFQENPEWWH